MQLILFAFTATFFSFVSRILSLPVRAYSHYLQRLILLPPPAWAFQCSTRQTTNLNWSRWEIFLRRLTNHNWWSSGENLLEPLHHIWSMLLVAEVAKSFLKIYDRSDLPCILVLKRMSLSAHQDGREIVNVSQDFFTKSGPNLWNWDSIKTTSWREEI